MHSAALVWVLAAPFGIGFLVLSILGWRWRDDRLAYPAWAWFAGAFALALGLFVALGFGVALEDLTAVPVAWVALLAPLGLFLQKRMARGGGGEGGGRSPAMEPVRYEPLYLAFVALVLAFVVVHAMAAGVRPALTGDEGNLWTLKAKVIHAAGGFGEPFEALTRDPARVLHKDYPLFDPLLQLWVFSELGAVQEFAHRLPIQAFGLSLVLLAAAGLRRLLPAPPAALGLVLLVSLPRLLQQLQRSSADLMVAAGLLLALDAWLRWSKRPEGRSLALVALGLAIAVWAKNEGMLYLSATGAALLGLHLLRRRRAGRPAAPARLGATAAAFALPLGAYAWTSGFNRAYGFQNDMMGDNDEQKTFLRLAVEQFGERVGVVTSYFWEHYLASASFTQGLFVVFLLGLVLLPRRALRGPRALPTLAIALVLLGYVVVYLGTPKPIVWHLRTSTTRLTLQVLPVLILWTALLVSPQPEDTGPDA